MAVRLYRYDDESAPTLNGQAGSLTNLLDAVLVNGYGTKPGAGWSISQTATNKRAYQQGTGGNHPVGIHMYIDDAAPGAAGAREARVCGFETMSAATPVGTGQFPTPSQSTIGFGALVIRKSSDTNATARKWYAVADAWTVYLFIEPGNNGNYSLPLGYAFMFGDFQSFKEGDAYAQIIVARSLENTDTASGENFSMFPNGRMEYTVNGNIPGHFVSRHWNQLASSQRAGKMATSFCGDWAMWAGTDTVGGDGNEGYWGPGSAERQRYFFPYPNPVDGALWMSPVYINQQGMRGYFKGLWFPQHHAPLNPGDTFTAATGNLAGKSFLAASSCMRWTDSNWWVNTQFFIEYSDTWPA